MAIDFASLFAVLMSLTVVIAFLVLLISVVFEKTIDDRKVRKLLKKGVSRWKLQ